jgi:hypothetical protein
MSDVVEITKLDSTAASRRFQAKAVRGRSGIVPPLVSQSFPEQICSRNCTFRRPERRPVRMIAAAS